MALDSFMPVLFALLTVTPAVLGLHSDSSFSAALLRDEDLSLKERPVAKVVRMLKEMLAELNAELEDDKAVYEMLKCWCETNEKEKTKAIEEGEAKIAQLEADIGEDLAKINELKEKIQQAKDAYNKALDALNKASAMRMKEK